MAAEREPTSPLGFAARLRGKQVDRSTTPTLPVLSDQDVADLTKAKNSFLWHFNKGIALEYKRLTKQALQSAVVQMYASETETELDPRILKSMYSSAMFWSKVDPILPTDYLLKNEELRFTALINQGIVVQNVKLEIPLPKLNTRTKDIFKRVLTDTCRCLSGHMFLDNQDIDGEQTEVKDKCETDKYLRIVDKFFNQDLHPGIFMELVGDNVIISVERFALYALKPDGAFGNHYSRLLDQAINTMRDASKETLSPPSETSSTTSDMATPTPDVPQSPRGHLEKLLDGINHSSNRSKSPTTPR